MSWLIFLLAVLALAPSPAPAMIFDVEARRAFLRTPPAAAARAACLTPRPADDLNLEPVQALRPTDGYGSDQASADFAWATMVLAGNALADDAAAAARLEALLYDWAKANALAASADEHDAHFALKRTLLPTIVAFTIVRGEMAADRRAAVAAWLDRLVAKIDRTFDGDVDRNNHRYLADAALAAWGAATGRGDLLAKAKARLVHALTEQLRPDGSFPMEARRGARATWYHRQAMASLTVIVMALRQAGADPLAEVAINDAWRRMTLFLLDSIRTPRIVRRYAAENYIPGPSDDYARQDLGFLDTRGHGRHYMAWAEAARDFLSDPYAAERFDRFFAHAVAPERPLIDEFSGGAGACFWWTPKPASGDRR